ncbi:MAG: hypothetical protein J4431_02640 [Candidatus Aenigmarchaeota archaeon]|nr:hypothetical protein [Candidatus Aenigmarchaeota archaeon]
MGIVTDFIKKFPTGTLVYLYVVAAHNVPFNVLFLVAVIVLDELDEIIGKFR